MLDLQTRRSPVPAVQMGWFTGSSEHKTGTQILKSHLLPACLSPSLPVLSSDDFTPVTNVFRLPHSERGRSPDLSVNHEKKSLKWQRRRHRLMITAGFIKAHICLSFPQNAIASSRRHINLKDVSFHPPISFSQHRGAATVKLHVSLQDFQGTTGVTEVLFRFILLLISIFPGHLAVAEIDSKSSRFEIPRAARQLAVCRDAKEVRRGADGANCPVIPRIRRVDGEQEQNIIRMLMFPSALPAVFAHSTGRVPQLHEGAAEQTGRPLRVRNQCLQPTVRQLHGKQRLSGGTG